MKRILLGLGNNVDYEIVVQADYMMHLIQKYQIKKTDIMDYRVIDNMRQLIGSILYYMKMGQGGERKVQSSSMIERFVKDLDYKVTMGGSSIRAAIVLDKLGAETTLHLVTINDYVREMLPAKANYISAVNQECLYPHLIVQYYSGQQICIGDIQLMAEYSNRIIYHNDQNNMVLPISEELIDHINSAEVFMISGLNAIKDRQKLSERLSQLTEYLDRTICKPMVFFEDACYLEDEYSRIVREALGSYIDLYSMNEDELMARINRSINILSVTEMKQALVDIRQILRVENIIVHTKYYALCYGRDAMQYEGALRLGVVVAGTRYRLGDDYEWDEIKKTSGFPDKKVSVELCSGLKQHFQNHLAIVASKEIDCDQGTTIGLGDSFIGGFIFRLAQKT